MKKYLGLLFVFFALSFSRPAQAHYFYCPPVVSAVYTGGAAFWPFFTATTGGFAVVYLIATGGNFPLCGQDGLNCYSEFPHDKNGE